MQAANGFSQTREQFAALADAALACARKLGASDAAVQVSESCGLSVSVRMGALENVERNRDKSLSITVHLGDRRGGASTSDFSPAAIEQTVRAAADLARYTAQDPFGALPDADLICPAQAQRDDLELFFPWAIDADAARELALCAEDAARATDRRISNSEGASVAAQQSHFWAAHTHGFRGGYATSRHSLSVVPIAGRGADMQRDYWYSSQRDPADLAAPQRVGRYAAERALSRLHPRRIATGEYPVLFEAPLAAGLLGHFVQAISGGALYRRTSFLLDSLHQPVWPAHIDVLEDPFVKRGKASSPFDDEGVRVAARHVVEAGVVGGYFLGSYSARKLGLSSTGNAGGSHNLVLRSRLTYPGDDLEAMLRKLGRGLFVTELLGSGVNPVTGDYSRGASGFWVEGGRIEHPVQEVTIAGNIKQMLAQVVAVGADAYTHGGKTTGSVLIERMRVAGA